MMQMIASRRLAQLGRSLVAGVVLLTIAGCWSVKLVSDYDSVTDKAVTDIQRKSVAFLLKMEAAAGTPAGEYANSKDFYDDVTVDISSALLRAQSIPHNDVTVSQLQNLQHTMDALKGLHELQGAAGLTGTLAKPSRDLIDQSCRAILTLELAKQRK